MPDTNSTRLNKYVSESGICSRRQADRYIEKGVVFLNGKRAKIGDLVFPGDKVMVNGITIEPKEENDFTLIAFNKPVGVTSTTEANVKGNIVDYVNHSDRIFPIGRLDKDSQGLIFLTNNGDIVNKILRAGNKHEKEYLVTVDKPITDSFIASMAAGVPMLGVMTKKCKVFKESTFVFRIILIQGLNRQIRRMCDYFDYQVVKLERTRIMNVTLKGLVLGEWRELTDEESAGIFAAIKSSTSVQNKQNLRTEAKKVGAAEARKLKRNNVSRTSGGAAGFIPKAKGKAKAKGAGRKTSSGGGSTPRKPGSAPSFARSGRNVKRRP